MKRKRVFAAFLSLVLAGQMAFSAIPAYAAGADDSITDAGTAKSDAVDPDASNKPMPDGNELRMWYTSPGSASDWENTSLVIGNGKTGGILFGQVANDQIHFNEKTLWTGGPSESRPNYDGGNRDEAVTEEQLEALRQKMDDHSEAVFPQGTSTTTEVWGDGAGMGQYQDFGDLYLDFSAGGMTNDNVENYVRDLDMRTGISSVNYDYEGVHYEREYFASHPDHAVVTRLTASEAGKISFTASVRSASGLTTTTKAENGKITLAGEVNDNQMKCEMQAQIVNEGGTLTNNEDGTVTVENADAVTIVYSTDTDYKNEYPVYRTGESAEELSASLAETVDAAAAKSYDDLRSAHVADYSELFGRVEIDLGGECAQKPIDEMMEDYRNGNHDHVLEEMIYQFGRYLTIGASREGDELPSNLCGIWMIGSAGQYWGADFHFNVNVEMNYWPAYQTNLAECGSVFTDYMESLVQPGRVTAEKSAAQKTEDVINTPIGEGNGFLVNTQNNPFGCTAPFGSQEYGWNVTGSSWALQNVYDQYLYTQDKELLEDTIYPMLKEMTNFWDGFLWWSDYQDRLVVGPSFSAEQGPTVNGTTYDQSLVWELYDMAIEASEILGVDADEREEWKETQSELNPIIIGDEGQVKEWYEETTTGKAQAGDLEEVDIPNFGAGGSANQGSLHRHTSQLIGLYPGTLINKDTEEWMEAAIKTLEIRDERGSAGEVGPAGTGWSKAHKLNMWARTGNGENTYKLISGMIAGNENGILDTFLDSHPPYQIDGNYGLTAGMNEALLQSQLGYTQFLPAISEAWSEGNVQGIVARGNFVIGMEWSNNSADRFTITSRSGGTFTGEYDNLAAYEVKTSDGTPVEVTTLSDDKISFPTEQGQTYVIDFNSTPAKLQAQIDEAKGLSDQMTDEVLATQKNILDSLIAEAEQVVAEEDSSQYYDQAARLGEANKVAAAAIELNSSYNDANAVYEARDTEEDWATYITTAADLKNQIDAAAALLAEEDCTVSELNAMKTAVDTAKDTLTGLWDRLTVTFAPESGQLEGEGMVTLSCEFDDLQIRYTTDGNDPMWFSEEYTEPFAVTQSKATVKAALFLGNRQMSEVFSTEYVGSLDAAEDLAQNYTSVDDEGNSSPWWGSPEGALDGKNYNAWEPVEYPATLTLTFDEPITVNTAEIAQSYFYEGLYDIADFNIEYWNGTEWVAAVEHESMGAASKTIAFDEFTSDQIRLRIMEAGPYGGTVDSFRLFYLKDEITTDRSVLDLILGIAGTALEKGEVDAAIESVRDNFNQVYEYAQVVSENINSSQTSIDNTTFALIDALQKLGFVAGDKTDLIEHYNLYSSLDLDRYFDGPEKDAFIEALEEAKTVIDDGDAMAEDVTAADQKLLDAAAALVLKADKTALQKLVDVASGYEEDNYLSTGWGTFENALANANEVLNDEMATQEEVDNAKVLLAQAMASLRFKADKSVLEEVLNKANNMDVTGYDAQKVAVFKAAVANAESVYADENLSVYEQPIVDAAVLDLQNAIAALEDPDQENPGSGDPEEPGQTTPGGNNDTDKPDQTKPGDNNDVDKKDPATSDKGDGQTTGDNDTQRNDNQNTSDGKTVQTGDTTNIWMPVAGLGIAVVAIAGLGVVVYRRRRK